MHNTRPKTHNSESRFLFILAGALILSLIILSLVLIGASNSLDHSKPSLLAKRAFPPVVVQARSAYVLDLQTSQVLFEKNASESLPLASLTKLMSALVASDAMHPGDSIKVTDKAVANYGDSGLVSGEKWSLKDLLDFSLITSSNDGMRAIALSLAGVDDFVVRMNMKARELGLSSLKFNNETGLDIGAAGSNLHAGGYGNARDMARLMAHILRSDPGLLEATRISQEKIFSLDNHGHMASNTNVLVDKIPGTIASKTGYTDLAGGNLAFAFDTGLGHPVVVVILGSSEDGRFVDAESLVNATMRYITQ